MATDVPPAQFSFPRALGMIQITPPGFQLSAQPVEIEIGKRSVRAADVAHGTLQNRARTDMVAFGFVMKSDCQLNHTLHVAAQGPVARQRTPDIFENFVGVEKMGSVEQIETSAEVPGIVRHGHSGLGPGDHSTLPENLHVSID